MPFAIELREPQNVIDVAFSGRVTVKERFEAMQAEVAAARTRGFKRVLADFSAARAKRHPQSEVLNYAVRLAEEPTLHKMAIAYVGTQDQTGASKALLPCGGTSISGSLRATRRFVGCSESLPCDGRAYDPGHAAKPMSLGRASSPSVCAMARIAFAPKATPTAVKAKQG